MLVIEPEKEPVREPTHASSLHSHMEPEHAETPLARSKEDDKSAERVTQKSFQTTKKSFKA